MKVLIVCDAGHPSGFERVGREIAAALQRNGFEVAVYGLGMGKDNTTQYPWRVLRTYKDPQDPLAVTRYAEALKKEKPQCVLMIQDLWNQANYLAFHDYKIPVVGYFPVDTPNMPSQHAAAAAAMTFAVTYTDFGAKETAIGVRKFVDLLHKQFGHLPAVYDDPATVYTQPGKAHKQAWKLRADRLYTLQDPQNWNVIPHGIDRSVFYKEDRAVARAFWQFADNELIYLNVNTNQFRKRLDATLRGFAKFVKSYTGDKRPVLVFHCQGGDRGGWDLGQLADYYGIADRVRCVHYLKPELTEAELRSLYNAADVGITTTGGEGWGLTAWEGAACGLPQIMPDWSTAKELWQDNVVYVPVDDYRVEPKGLNTLHAQVAPQHVAAACEFLANDYTREIYATRALNAANQALTWSKVGDAFTTIIRAAIASHNEYTPRTLRELVEAPKTPLVSLPIAD